MMWCTIMQKTKFPGYFEPIPLWQLQRAEYDLRFNQRHYYERARRMGELFLYSFDDATRIVGYCQQNRPWAEFLLLATPFDERRK